MPAFNDTNDFLNKSSILRRASVNRQHFDPTNAQHVESLKTFIETGNWGEVQFYCEYPFTDVPTTVLTKFVGFQLNVRRQTAEEVLAARILAGQSLLGSPADEAALDAAA